MRNREEVEQIRWPLQVRNISSIVLFSLLKTRGGSHGPVAQLMQAASLASETC